LLLGPTDPGHAATAKALLRERITIARPPRAEVEIRCLADYDTALGLTEASR